MIAGQAVERGRQAPKEKEQEVAQAHHDDEERVRLSMSVGKRDGIRPGDIVVRGQAVELAGGDVPYGVVADMLRDLRRLNTGVGRTLEKSVRADLGDLLTTLTGGVAPPLERGQLLDSIVTLVETLGHGRLLWWLVEDVHWADTSSRDVLAYVIRAMGPAQVLMTMTVRTGEPWPETLSDVPQRPTPKKNPSFC